MSNNKELAAEVEHLCHQLEAADQERAELEAQNQNLVGQLNNKEREKISKLSLYRSRCVTRIVALFVVTAVMQA